MFHRTDCESELREREREKREKREREKRERREREERKRALTFRSESQKQQRFWAHLLSQTPHFIGIAHKRLNDIE